MYSFSIDIVFTHGATIRVVPPPLRVVVVPPFEISPSPVRLVVINGYLSIGDYIELAYVSNTKDYTTRVFKIRRSGGGGGGGKMGTTKDYVHCTA